MADAPKPQVTAEKHSVDDVVAAFKASKLAHLRAVFLDGAYLALDHTDWLTVLQATRTSAIKYVPEFDDCDDRAFLLRGLVPAQDNVNGIAVVIDEGAQHCYNAVLVRDGKGGVELKAVEPQLDAFAEAGTGHYMAEKGMIIF